MAELTSPRRSSLPYMIKTMNALFAKGPSLQFDGNNRKLGLVALAAELCNANNLFGAIEVVFKPNRAAAADDMILASFGNNAAGTDIRLGYDLNRRIKAYCRIATVVQWELIAANSQLVLGDIYHLVLSHNGIRPIVYLNGTQLIMTDTIAVNLTQWLAVIAANFDGRIGCFRNGATAAEGQYFDGEIYRLRVHNRALSLTNIWHMIIGPIDYKHTDAITNNHLVAAVPGNWAAGGVNIAVGAGDANMLLYVYAGAGAGTLTQVFANLNRAIQDKKRYRFTYFVTIGVAPDGALTGVLTGISPDAVPLDLTAGAHTVEFDSNFGLGAANFVITLTAAAATVGTVTIGLMRLIEIGCVAALEPEIICGGKWCDSMHSSDIGTALVPAKDLGAVQIAAGVNPIAKVPTNHECVLKFKGINGDLTFVNAIPQGYRIMGVSVRNRTANAMRLDILAAAVAVVDNEALPAAAAVTECTVDVPNTTWAAGASDVVFQDNAGTGWNAAVLDIAIFLKRMI
jgi:hypothetical protein